tara:strand:+ start:64 stop:690 length:627 start_codon:yes stop_codon:yes gene_type:complete
VEIREIGIPEIVIPDVYIPQVILPSFDVLNVETIGCKYYHRDTKNTGNRNLLIDDPNGVTSSCPYPSFIPMNYQPESLIITEEAAPVEEEPTKLPEGKPPQAEIPKDKKDEPIVPPCPDKNDQRVGDFRNEKRLERVTGHKRGDDGIECITIYENVPFKDQYIPEVSTIVSTAVIGLVAASTPLLLNAVKPLVKQVVKKLSKKKSTSD